MSESHAVPEDCEPGSYQIRVRGHFDSRWTARFEGMSLTLEENGDTLLTGAVTDQAALHGLLRKIRDLGIPLISVARVKVDQASAPCVDQKSSAHSRDSSTLTISQTGQEIPTT